MTNTYHHGSVFCFVVPLAVVRQYLSTNSAKSTFLCNSGLVVKVTSSKSPTEQNLPTRQSDISVLQTQVQSLMDVVSETRIVVEKCCQDMNGFETRLSDIRFVVEEQWRKKRWRSCYSIRFYCLKH